MKEMKSAFEHRHTQKEIDEMVEEFKRLDRAFYETGGTDDTLGAKVREIIAHLENAGVNNDFLRSIDSSIYDEFVDWDLYDRRR